MSLFEFCIEIIKREGQKFNIGINTVTASQITAATASDINFDIAHNRCAFLYRCGTINLSFAKDCFKIFLSDDKSLILLLSNWINCPDLTVCSISKGPALDYIAFLLSYQECAVFPSLFKKVKVVSKYGAWRNTVNVMLDILNEGFLKSLPSSAAAENIEVIQGDPFEEFTEKVRNPICNSDLILMVKALNILADECVKKNSKQLKEFLNALKPGAVIFCIDTKPSISLMTSNLSAFVGKFLFEPTFINTSINVENAEFYKDIFGCFPVISARGSFFVWQKSKMVPTLNSEYEINELSQSMQSFTISNVQKYLSDLPEDKYSEQVVASTSTSSGSCTVFSTNKILKTSKSSGSDQESLGNTNIDAQNSKYFLSSSSLSGLLTNKKDENVKLEKISTLVNRSIQTEPEENETDSFKIVELTNRIAQLTIALSEMLQTNETEDYKNRSLNDFEMKRKNSLSNECNHCCASASCVHSSPCKHILESVGNCWGTCKCSQKRVLKNHCQHHPHQQGYFTTDLYASNVSLNSNFEADKQSSKCNCRLNFPAENNSVSTPKLVIPLSNLSASAVSQIISIISQSNQRE